MNLQPRFAAFISTLLLFLSFSCEEERLSTDGQRTIIASSFQNGATVASGSPNALGITDSFDLAPFDSIGISFTASFSKFPPEDFEEPYSIFVRRHEPPNDFFYFDTPAAGTSEHIIVISASVFVGPSASFEVGASSNAPINAVLVSISSLSIYGWSK